MVPLKLQKPKPAKTNEIRSIRSDDSSQTSSQTPSYQSRQQMAKTDRVRYIMKSVAQVKDVTKPLGNSTIKSSKEIADISDELFPSLESKLLLTFHGGDSVRSLINAGKYISCEVSRCKTALFLRIVDNGDGFRLYSRGTEPLESHLTYKLENFPCINDILTARVPVLHNDVGNHLKKLLQWKNLFGYIPDLVVGIPILDCNGKIPGVVALSFKGKLPKGFFEKKLPVLRETLGILVPYILMNQRTSDFEETSNQFNMVMESIDKVARVMGTESELALTQIGLEFSHLLHCKNLTVFVIDEGDGLLRKYHSHLGTPGRSGCPNKQLHRMVDIPMSLDEIESLDWVAKNKQGMLINQLSDYAGYQISPKCNHSIGNCIVRAMMLVPVVDYSGESPLLIELTERDKTFSPKAYELALIFSQHVACLLTCAKLLDKREKNFRRRNIINEMLCSIKFVKPTTVEQFITHHRKTSMMFRGNFDDFSLCIRCFTEQDIAGIALELFYELGLVKDFKIRRSILIRFIVSVQQGYGALPYHNWYHAVSVAHYAYLLIRKLDLIKRGHINKLESFALVVSALTHDVDHRGTNNQFQSYTNSDIYKLYNCEDSVMERHHLAIALAILHREDCNILESFSDTDYKDFVENLTRNIIATDISKHMKIREKLFTEAEYGNPKQKKHAKLSLFMTAADLCDGCKKWDDNLPTVKGILQEFFNQGDMERQLGFQPVAMMDRNVAYIPSIEYKFTKFIVLPVYSFLSGVYSELRPCVENIVRSEELWTRATFVFDKHLSAKTITDQLEILDLPDMKEDKLMRLPLNATLEEIRQEKLRASPAIAVTKHTSQKLASISSVSQMGVGFLIEDDLLADVDTGENRDKKCRCCRCICMPCCPCRKKKKPNVE